MGKRESGIKIDIEKQENIAIFYILRAGNVLYTSLSDLSFFILCTTDDVTGQESSIFDCFESIKIAVFTRTRRLVKKEM